MKLTFSDLKESMPGAQFARRFALRKSVFLFIFGLSLALTSSPAYGKGETSKIVIKGPGITTPIVIKDPGTLAKFRVWSGPGTSSNEKESLIINWSEGVVNEPPRRLPRYEVSFYARFQEERLVYVVFYEYDTVNDKGYVYLPGNSDEWYRLNVGTIYHSNEGHWFHASRSWEITAKDLLLTRSVKPNH